MLRGTSLFCPQHMYKDKRKEQNTKHEPRASHMQYPHVLYPSLTRGFMEIHFLFQFELKHEDI